MAITLVGTASGTNTATMPAHVAGDLILLFAFRDGSTSYPTAVAGWTGVSDGAANLCALRVARKIAASSSEVVGTWTNATTVTVIVLRGVDQTTPVGAVSVGGASSTTVSFPALTMQVMDGTSAIVASVGHRSADVAIDTLPSGMTLARATSDATDEAAVFYLLGAASFTSRNTSVGGTASGYRTVSIEVRASAPTGTQYPQTISVTSSGGVTRALSIGKRATVAGLASISVRRAVTRSIAVASSAAVAALKAASRSIGLSSAGSVAAIVSRAYLLALAIASSGAATISKATGKRSSIAGAGSVTARKALGKSLALSSAGAASIRKAAGKVASGTSFAVFATQKAVDAQRAVLASAVVSAVKSLSVVLSAASAGIVDAFKTVGASFSVILSGLSSLVTAFTEATGFLGKISTGAAAVSRIAAGVIKTKPSSGKAQGKGQANPKASIRRIIPGITKRKR